MKKPYPRNSKLQHNQQLDVPLSNDNQPTEGGDASSFDEATHFIDYSVDQIAEVLNSFRTWYSDIHRSIGYGKFWSQNLRSQSHYVRRRSSNRYEDLKAY